VEEVVVGAGRDASAGSPYEGKSAKRVFALDDPRIHLLGKNSLKRMDCRIKSGNDGNAVKQFGNDTSSTLLSASISPVKFEHCAERLSETFMR
jgi:hypothetical protein